MVATHRLAWEMVNGPIPEGMFICHHCDNPPCVRPDHLFCGSPSDNVRDAIQKGRIWPDGVRPLEGRFGERHPKSKLTDQQRREIIDLARSGVPRAAIAEQFGICQHTVSRIKLGKSGPRDIQRC
jgi:hypothetical protein